MITAKICAERFEEAISTLARVFTVFEGLLPGPVLVDTAHGKSPRYRPELLEHALLMKLARVISVTEAMRILVKAGHVHEQGILQRVHDETAEDILFLALGKKNGIRSIHRQYLKHFWREEFDGPADPATYKMRHMVRRSEIEEYIAKQIPLDYGVVGRMIYGVFSGFIHGASTHIFDLINPRSLKYQLTGVADAADRLGYFQNALNYPLRSLMAAVVVAQALGEQGIAADLLARSDNLQAWMDKVR